MLDIVNHSRRKVDNSSGPSLIHLLKASFQNQGGEASIEAQTLLERIQDFFSSNAQDVMVPRTQMTSVPQNCSIKEALLAHHESGHSRIPVFDGRKDHIVGILHAIDLFPLVTNNELEKEVREVMRKPLFVSYSQALHQILANFKQAHTHMALVVDEYGGVDGVVTLSDILEELVGDIPDEFDKELEPTYEEVEGGLIVIDANYSLEDFNQLYHTDFKKEGTETIGGYAMHILGDIPSPGDRFKLGKLQAIVEESNERQLVKLTLPAPSPVTL